MKVYCFILFFTLSINSMAQFVQSDCKAATSIIKSYQNDADRLVLKHYSVKNYSEKDSIPINPMYSDTLLKALISVYNATDLIARDTVVDIFNIHTSWNGELNFLQLEADSSLFWMNELEQYHILTGYAPIDDFLIPYNFEILNYWTSNSDLHWVDFATDTNINIQAICNKLSLLPGIALAKPGTNSIAIEEYYSFQQSSNITAYVKADHVELNYTKTWGSAVRTWQFKAYYDCTVEYIGSHGASVYLSDPAYSLDLLTSYPNPATDKIRVNGPFLFVKYDVIDINGKIVQSGSVARNDDIFIDKLSSGNYFLNLQSNLGQKTIKFIKE